MLKGIDVSHWNGKLDWDALKSKIDFAIIRLGYRKASNNIDTYAGRNMSECDRLGIPYGLYIYSYALNETGVKKEAEFAISMAKKGNPVLGVYFDMEDADSYKKNNGLDPYSNAKTMIKFCKTFVSALTKAGYESGVYANGDYFKNVLTDRTGFGNIWYASWTNKTTCPVSYAEVWQYSDSGLINGKKFDMNYYVDTVHFKKLTATSTTTVTESTEETKKTTTTALKHKVGETVNYNKIYASSSSTKALNPYYTSGKITKIYSGTKHPYLIDNSVGYIDDDCITTASSTTFANGTKVKLKKGSTWYDGTKVATFVFNVNLYVIGTDSRGVLVSTSKGGTCTGVAKASDLQKA